MATGTSRFDWRTSPGQPVGYIPGLDGLRAVAVLLVLFSHYGFPLVPGGLGVTIFFFISGLLITTLLVIEIERRGRVRLAAFYMRRFLRLAPELIAFILISSLLAQFLGKPTTFAAILSVMFYYYNYFQLFSASLYGAVSWGQIWSLSVEEHFYLLYPIAISVFISRKRLFVIILAALIVGPLLRRWYVELHDFPSHYSNHATDTRIDSIVFGCVCALLFRYSDEVRAIFFRFGAAIGVASLAALIATLGMRDALARETVRYSIQGVAIGGIFAGLYFAAAGQQVLSLLETRTVAWVGRMSYGAYLWHLLPLQLLVLAGFSPRSSGPFALKAAAALLLIASSFFLAMLSHRFVFHRAARLRHKFGSHNPR